MTILAHDCWMCRTLASASDISRDALFSLAYAAGYGEGITTARGDLEWEKLPLCHRHGDKVPRHATSSGGSRGSGIA